MDNLHSYERYQRQVILKGFGEAGQAKLLQAKVLVIGAGGLGCPALLYLAAAGIGTLGIVDDDVVQLNNLHRQVLYTTEDIGKSKAEKAAEKLSRVNPGIRIITFAERLTVKNAFSIINDFDIVIDGTDNFASRYLINDACVLMEKTLVYGAVSTYEGQVAVFNKKNQNESPVSYRDLFPDPPQQHEVANCAEAGVLGVLPGLIGTMQANETIKLLIGIGEPLINRILTYSSLTNESYQVAIPPNTAAASLIPSNRAAFENTDYEWLCGSTDSSSFEIDLKSFNMLLAEGEVDVIDVREYGETPTLEEIRHQEIPLGDLENHFERVKNKTVVALCQTGARSLQAAKKLKSFFGSAKHVYSLRGGILAWKKHHEKELR
jgi:adenylyltransferase/sulfurtransferase